MQAAPSWSDIRLPARSVNQFRQILITASDHDPKPYASDTPGSETIGDDVAPLLLDANVNAAIASLRIGDPGHASSK